MKYLGRTFKNHEELMTWVKEGKIAEYKKLMKMLSETTDAEYAMAIVVKSSELENVLIKQFGMTPTEIEAIEIEAVKNN